MRRAGIWVRAIRVMSHICDLTRYFHTGRLTAQTQLFRNLSDRHPLGPEGRRNGSPLSGGKRTFCGIMSALPPKADIWEGGRKTSAYDPKRTFAAHGHWPDWVFPSQPILTSKVVSFVGAGHRGATRRRIGPLLQHRLDRHANRTGHRAQARRPSRGCLLFYEPTESDEENADAHENVAEQV